MCKKFISFLFILFTLSSCETVDDSKLLGKIIGSGLGALVGFQFGSGVGGALFIAGGTVLGGFIGWNLCHHSHFTSHRASSFDY